MNADGKQPGCVLKWGTRKNHQSRSGARHTCWRTMGGGKYTPFLRFLHYVWIVSCRQEKSDTTSSFLKTTLRYCHFFSRALAFAVAVVFAIYLIYLITYEPDSAGAVGMRVTLSFRQCWLNGSKMNQRCDWQIAGSFQGIDRQHSIKKKDIWSDSLTQNFSAIPASGTWEGEFLVGFSPGSIGEAVVLEESLRRMSERDLLDIALLNALPDPPFLSRIHIIKVCSSSKLSEGRPRFVQSVAKQVHREKLRELVTPIPDCIFTL